MLWLFRMGPPRIGSILVIFVGQLSVSISFSLPDARLPATSCYTDGIGRASMSYHASKQAARQLTLVTGVHVQTAARNHEALLQTLQRPATNPLRQYRPPP